MTLMFRISVLIFLLLPIRVWASGECVAVPEGSAQPRPKIVISDLHLGPGRTAAGGPWNALEDFRFAETFRSFLTEISKDGAVDLIIAGDFIDFWQIKPELNGELGATQDDSVKKVRVALFQHGDTFSDLARFMEKGNRLVLVPGNHDADLQWPGVQQAIREKIGSTASANLIFASPCYRAPGLHVEHGHQHDYANHFNNPAAPMVEVGGTRRLETNWGTVFVSSFYNQVEGEKAFIDNLQPSLAAVWWALRSEPTRKFAIPQIGKLLVMLLRDQSALHNLGYLAYSLGPTEVPKNAPAKTVDNLVGLYAKADPVLAEPLSRLMEDPEARMAAEQALADLPDQKWREAQIVKENATLGKRFHDPYVDAADDIVLDDPSVKVVVMGHTHDLERTKITALEGGDRWYANTGCWQKSLSVKKAKQDWVWSKLDLDNTSMFKDRFSYVAIRYDKDGSIQKPARSFWPAQ